MGKSPQWLEEGLRGAFSRDARKLLAGLFADPQLQAEGDSPRPLEKRHKRRQARIQTLSGPVEITRNYYYRTPSGTGRCPLDECLGLVEGFSPAMARLMCHAAEHARRLADAIFGPLSQEACAHRKRWIEEMKETSPDAMLQQARDLLEETELPQERLDAAKGEITYFETHAARTRYGEFRAKGLFIGSGVIEAGCKCVVGRRFKQSGMFWSQTGAENLLSLRCLILGPHFEATWAARRQPFQKKQIAARRWNPSLN